MKFWSEISVRDNFKVNRSYLGIFKLSFSSLFFIVGYLRIREKLKEIKYRIW